jgi:hypothetical protein
MSKLAEQIDEIKARKERIAIEEVLAIQKAMHSTDPDAIMKANLRWKDLEPREESGSKSMIFDPNLFSQSTDYKYKPYALSYNTLRQMAKVPVVRAIIGTRIEQVAAFSEPQSDKYGIGFVVRKKNAYGTNDKEDATSEDKKRVQWLTEFILNCGTISNAWHGDSFDTFLRKITKDSLELDQMAFEVVRNRKGQPVEFLATDGATYRLADSFDDEHYKGTAREMVNGYYPSYVQVHDESVLTEFYPWELCLGIRNHSTDLNSNGYGRSELEDIVQIITWMLYGDNYNGKFFSQGSAPKGILKVSGNVNTARLNEFRQQWGSMMQGVGNAHKTPVIESDKMEWIDMQKTNRDMEFQKWQEYLIQIACAVYKIAPDECGFEVTGSGGSSMIDNSSNEAKLQFSRDKGLRPLLKFIQRKINKFIINPIDPDYEFLFMGIDSDTEKDEIEMDIKKGGSFMGYKELRRKHNLPEDLDEGDAILSSAYLQMQAMSMQGNPDSNAAVDSQYGGDNYDLDAPANLDKSNSSNPLVDSLNEFIANEIYKP